VSSSSYRCYVTSEEWQLRCGGTQTLQLRFILRHVCHSPLYCLIKSDLRSK
jgi:hypothetical protein